jgi:WD40 repeat protein
MACPPVEAQPVLPSITTLKRVPATVPFSCQPLPRAFVFPPPGADVPGQFSRCASLEVGAVNRMAFSPDGGSIALAAADGIVRVVEVASRQVVAVLPAPRATIDFVAYEPAGRGILTLASGEREVTLWRTSDWAPVWTVSLPGHRYQQRFGGGVAFAPDGRSAIVSAGDDTFLLDVATGATLARHTATGVTLDVAYGWGGKRVVVAEASTAAPCVHAPNGGVVSILDGATLEKLANVANLGDSNAPGGYRGIPAFSASPTGDFVLVGPNVDQPPALLTYRLSNATALAPLSLTAMPVAFMPDGTGVVVRANGQLEIVDLDGRGVLASTPDSGTGPVAVSPDGKSIALGGSAHDMLRVWNVGDPLPSPVCGTADSDAPAAVTAPVSLSGDGQYVAVGTGSQLRLFRIADAFVLRSFEVDPGPIGRVVLSPDVAFVLAASNTSPPLPMTIIRTVDGGFVNSLPAGGWWWPDVTFSPRGDELYAVAYNFDDSRLYVANLAAPGLTLIRSISNNTRLIGFSQGCPVLYDYTRGAWRSCGGCDDAPIGGGEGSAAMLSPDGRTVAIRGAHHGPGVTILAMQPGWAPLRTISQRPEESAWMPDEYPVAITSGAARVATGADPAQNCYGGPWFETRVRDVATGALIDSLPPDVGSVDREARTFAYGTQIWCAR